jgi:uncharacterized protein YkwD
MSGVIRLLVLPVAALSLLLMGCGVPIAPVAMTATAVSEEQAAPPEAAALPAFSGGAGDTSATLLTPSERDSAEPIPTLAQPTPSATPEAGEAPPGDVGGPDATAEQTEPTPEGTPASDASLTPEASASPAETALPTETPEPTSTPQPVVANVNGSFVTEFLALLNAQRTGRGLPALAFNDTLAAGATDYAGYMGTGGFFGHYAPDGSSPDSRVIATGYSGAYNGEALAAGQWTPQAALNALLASAPHAKILLDPRSVEVGVGYAFVEGSRYRHYWVVVTGIP